MLILTLTNPCKKRSLSYFKSPNPLAYFEQACSFGVKNNAKVFTT